MPGIEPDIVTISGFGLAKLDLYSTENAGNVLKNRLYVKNTSSNKQTILDNNNGIIYRH